MKLTTKDREILRSLADTIAGIARLPIHREKSLLWQRLNDKRPERPMVWINEIPWHEMNVNDELTLYCEHEWARGLEQQMKRTIYQWKHMPGDMIVSDYLACPLIIKNTGLGIKEDVEIRRTDENSGIVSREFHAQIKEPEDIALIQDPVVSLDVESTEDHFSTMEELFRDIIEVRKEGIPHIWFTPWDNLIRLWGVEQAMIDLVLRPDMVNAIVARFVEASMKMLDQYEELNLLSLGISNNRVGSGGYGYVSDLPGTEFDPSHPRPKNMWGCSNAQIFSDVSPEMHWEFAVRHDLPWLARWGVTYYGCCEPLDNKIEVLGHIPNLRKISVSPWVKMPRIVREVEDRYVYSRKPNPAIFAMETWNPDQAGKAIRDDLDVLEGCPVELIMKDISTVKYAPQRLWEWEKIAMEEATRR